MADPLEIERLDSSGWTMETKLLIMFLSNTEQKTERKRNNLFY